VTQPVYSPLLSRRTPGGIYTVADIEQVPGRAWFVEAATGADTTSNGYSPDKPFATLAYAFSSDLVAADDVVYVMPGHTETVDAAGDITMDIAGVRVVGLGTGSLRPTFTFATSTAATWLITAANITVENVLITTSGVIDVVNAITVSAADVRLVDVEVRESAANSQFVDPLIITTGGARCRIDRYVCRSHASGDAIQSGILVDAAVDGVEINDALIDGLFATGNIESTAAATNTVIRRPILRQRHASQAAAVNLHASHTGFVTDAAARITLATAAGFNGAYVGAAAQFIRCQATNAAATAGAEPVLATGRIVSKASGAITGNPTINTFTIAGGEVIIRDLWFKVTTDIAADGGTLAAQINPTTGDTYTVVTATDLGTTNTTAGSVVGLDQGTTAASKFLRGGRTNLNAIATTGTFELVGASGVDGAVTVYCVWEPVVAGATLVAS
jgi:hypothetical protein